VWKFVSVDRLVVVVIVWDNGVGGIRYKTCNSFLDGLAIRLYGVNTRFRFRLGRIKSSNVAWDI